MRLYADCLDYVHVLEDIPEEYKASQPDTKNATEAATILVLYRIEQLRYVNEDRYDGLL